MPELTPEAQAFYDANPSAQAYIDAAVAAAQDPNDSYTPQQAAVDAGDNWNEGPSTPQDFLASASALPGGTAVHASDATAPPALPATTTAPVATGPKAPAPAPSGLPAGTVPNPAVSPSQITNQTPATATNLLKDYLEADPQLMLGYAANTLRARGVSSNFMSWFQRNGNTFWQQYLGVLASQAISGRLPDVSFVDFVTWLDPTGQYFGANVRDTGRTTNRFAEWLGSRG